MNEQRAAFTELIRLVAIGADPSRLLQALERVHREVLRDQIRIRPVTAGEPTLEAIELKSDEDKLLGWMTGVPPDTPLGVRDILADLSSAVLDCPAAYQTRAAMMADLMAASHVLTEMLPREPLVLAGGQVSGWVQPAQVVGGDCFDYFGSNEEIKFLLADAVGHGLSATLMSLECRALWRALYRTRNLEETVSALNLYLSAEARGDERFVACCMGKLDLATGRAEYVCAGLAPCFVKQSSGVVVHSEADLPLGVVADASFTERTDRLEPGDSLLFLTDGVSEWMNADRELFGEDRIIEFLEQAEAGTDLPRELLSRLQDFTRGYPQLDDAAVLALSRF